jgi:hypothetical protein
MDTGSFPGVKRPGRGVDHPPSSSAEVKKRVDLYLYSPLGLHGLLYGELYVSTDNVTPKMHPKAHFTLTRTINVAAKFAVVMFTHMDSVQICITVMRSEAVRKTREGKIS